VYPVGRLDADSEGLLILSDQPDWNARLLRPGKGHEREYWVQSRGWLRQKAPALERGVKIQGRERFRLLLEFCRTRPIFPQESTNSIS